MYLFSRWLWYWNSCLRWIPSEFVLKDGLNGTDRDRNLGILEKMKNISNRKINFVTAIALADTTNNISIVKEHIISGTVASNIRGENGFGFDEIFELENGKTIAELSSEEKNSLSPRKLALEEIKKELNSGDL